MRWKIVLILGTLVFLIARSIFQTKKLSNEPLISPMVTPVLTTTLDNLASVGAVLAVSVSATEAASPSALVTQILTPRPKKEIPTAAPSPTPVAASSQEVNGFIERFSGQYSVDPHVIRYIALCESGFNSNATNGKYAGLFQFDEITWKNVRKEMGEEPNPELRFSAEESIQTTAHALSKGKGKLWPNCIP